MTISLIIVLAIAIGGFAFMRQPQFGKLPSGERLALIEQAPNYRDGAFQNESHTPDLSEGVSYWDVMMAFLFGRSPNLSPVDTLPSVKTDLLALSPEQDVLVWFGHSSYFMQIGGKKFLVDPVLSGSASPLPFGTKAFPGTDRYGVDDLPEIDVLFISHDHWDHLDYKTIKALRPKVRQVICGLGVGAHFEHWGYDPSLLVEKNWNEQIELDEGFSVHTLPARHFSGRGLKRNQSLWLSFVLHTPDLQIFIGGDSGYDSHFSKIGEQFGPFDLAILENGQYDEKWRYIHLMPEDILVAAKELQAKSILPVHSAKFVLGNHAWDEPLSLIAENAERENMRLLTPRIGELLHLKDTAQVFERWWEGLR